MIWIFWLHECLNWRLTFNSKSLFWRQSGQILEVRAIEQRHHEFACLLTSSDHDVVPITYHLCIFVLKYFLNRFLMLRFQSVIFIKTFKAHTNFVPSGRWYVSYRHYFLRALYIRVVPNAEGFSVVRPWKGICYKKIAGFPKWNMNYI